MPLFLPPLLHGPDRALLDLPHPGCTHHKQQLLNTLGHHVVKVAEVEVQGRPAYQLLLAQWAPVFWLHSMLGECMSLHLVRFWAQEAAVWTAVYLGSNIWAVGKMSGRGTHHQIIIWIPQHSTSPTTDLGGASQVRLHLNPSSL
jgi:hypothetical protein